MQKYLSDTQAYILNRLRNDETNFYGHQEEFQTVRDLLKKTVEFGESNSALVIGPPRSGKSTVSTRCLCCLIKNFYYFIDPVIRALLTFR